MCSFTVWGGGSQYLVWPPFASRSATHLLHRVDQVVDCGLCNVGPLLFNGCVKFWILQEQEHAVVYADPEHTKHAQWVTCTVSMLAMQELGFFSASRNCVQILATWGHALPCCGMRWCSRMNGSTMGLRISSQYLCAFKIPSIKCTCFRSP